MFGGHKKEHSGRSEQLSWRNTSHGTTQGEQLGRRLWVGHVQMAAAGSPVCTPFCPANNYLAESGVRLFVVTRDHVEFVVSLIHPLLPRAGHAEFNATKRDAAGIYRSCEACEYWIETWKVTRFALLHFFSTSSFAQKLALPLNPYSILKLVHPQVTVSTFQLNSKFIGTGFNRKVSIYSRIWKEFGWKEIWWKISV